MQGIFKSFISPLYIVMKFIFSIKKSYDLMHEISAYLFMINLKKKIQFYEGMLAVTICCEDFNS